MKCNNELVNEKLIQVAGGDKEALDVLYIHTGKLIYSYILSMTGNITLTEDIRQDVFVKIAENINTYKSGTNPMAWIIQIAKNTTINVLNRQKRQPVTFSNMKEDIENVKDISKQSDIENRNLLEFLMDKLPQGNREIVMLHLYGGYSQVEISKLLMLPLTTVQWRYRTAIKALRKYYTDNEI